MSDEWITDRRTGRRIRIRPLHHIPPTHHPKVEPDYEIVGYRLINIRDQLVRVPIYKRVVRHG